MGFRFSDKDKRSVTFHAGTGEARISVVCLSTSSVVRFCELPSLV